MLGFIGTGAITEAIITGLYKCGNYQEKILISERSRDRSAKLHDLFPSVEIVTDNQSIVDRCDDIVIAVLPDQAQTVLSSLQFRSQHRVVSVVAGIKLDVLSALIKPATQVCRAIPMPPIEFGLGPVPICPRDERAEALFNRVGTAVAVDNEAQFTALATGSSVMAAFFELVASLARWLEQRNVPAKEASLYATNVIHSLACLTIKSDASTLQTMSEQCLTVGGLNEQVLLGCKDAGWIEIMQKELDRIMTRLEKS
ncbi:MAG: NAD(P)-binding domain-containing protein [Gammaproteobacteria bacterium]|nr:NAD(P)-binding domain-containing protein [Gammaproteobacteria bacterium]